MGKSGRRHRYSLMGHTVLKHARRRKSKYKSSRAAWSELEYSPPIFIGKIPEKKEKLNYEEKLKNPKWRRKRNEIFKRDNYACQNCGSRLNLQVHHWEYIWGREPWDYADENLITLCKICHTKEHDKLKN